MYCTRGECHDISCSPATSHPDLSCNHLEADTSMFYVLSRLEEKEESFVIDSEDADVVVLAAHVGHKFSGVLGIKRKKRIFDCKLLCTSKMAEVAIRLHVMTGCDSVSSFFGIGKKAVWKQVSNNLEAQQLRLDFSDEALTNFTIKYIYRDNQSSTLAQMREKEWRKMKKKSLARAGIDNDTSLLRINRVQYQTAVFENYAEQFSTICPLNGGYYVNGNVCVPIKYTKPALPDELVYQPVDVLNDEENAIDREEDDSDDDDEEDMDEGLLSVDYDNLVDSDVDI